MGRRIFVDLDCVIADWIGGVAREFAVPVSALYANWPPGEYGVNGPLARALGEPKPLTDARLWAQLDRKPQFWSELEELPWAADLLDLCLSYDANFRVITSPSWCPSSYAGKVEWLKRKFGPRFARFAVYPFKEDFSRPGATLIDDYFRNCGKFVEGGGEAVLFPCHHNVNWRLKTDPVPYVAERLEDIYAHG